MSEQEQTWGNASSNQEFTDIDSQWRLPEMYDALVKAGILPNNKLGSDSPFNTRTFNRLKPIKGPRKEEPGASLNIICEHNAQVTEGNGPDVSHPLGITLYTDNPAALEFPNSTQAAGTDVSGSDKATNQSLIAAQRAQGHQLLAAISKALSNVNSSSMVATYLKGAAEDIKSILASLSSDSSASVITFPDIGTLLSECGMDDTSVRAVLADIEREKSFEKLRTSTAEMISEIFDKRAFDKYVDIKDPEEREKFFKGQEALGKYAKEQSEKGKNQSGKDKEECDLKSGWATQEALRGVEEHGGKSNDEFRAKKAAYDKLIADAEKRARAKYGDAQVDKWQAEAKNEVMKYMKAEGLSDKEISQRLSAYTENPLDAASDLLRFQGKSQDEATREFLADTRNGLKNYLDLTIDSKIQKNGNAFEVSYHFMDDPAKKMALMVVGAMDADIIGNAKDSNSAARKRAYYAVLADAEDRMRASGQGEHLDQWKTEISKDVTKFLKDKGVSDTEIARLLEQNAKNPFEAASKYYDLNDKVTQEFLAEAQKDLKQFLGVDFTGHVINQGNTTQIAYSFTNAPTDQFTLQVVNLKNADRNPAKPIVPIDTLSAGTVLKGAGVQHDTDAAGATTAFYHGVERPKQSGTGEVSLTSV